MNISTTLVIIYGGEWFLGEDIPKSQEEWCVV